MTQNENRKTTRLVFLGNSVRGILADAAKEFGDEVSQVLIIAADHDQLIPPEGVPSVTVTEFAPEPGTDYILVANGGRSVQLVPTLLKLERAGVAYRAYDLQPDGCAALGGKRWAYVIEGGDGYEGYYPVGVPLSDTQEQDYFVSEEEARAALVAWKNREGSCYCEQDIRPWLVDHDQSSFQQ